MERILACILPLHMVQSLCLVNMWEMFTRADNRILMEARLTEKGQNPLLFLSNRDFSVQKGRRISRETSFVSMYEL